MQVYAHFYSHVDPHVDIQVYTHTLHLSTHQTCLGPFLVCTRVYMHGQVRVYKHIYTRGHTRANTP